MASSNSMENYIKSIYHLAKEKEWVNTNDLANRMNTKPSSATDMVQKLDQKALVKYQKYKGVQLTDKGKKLALKVIRKHRLWEVFLQQKLGFAWDEVHEIAEQLEHISSPELVRRLDHFLDFPEYDPHGDPIPSEDGKIKKSKRILLSECNVQDKGKLVAVNDSSPAFLQLLEHKKMTLGTQFHVKVIHEYDGSFDITLNDTDEQLNLSSEVVQNIYIIKTS